MFKDPKIVIVEDDRLVLFFHKNLVVKSGLDSSPLTFLNGKEALDYFCGQTFVEEPHLILLDINMPVMNGWELLEELKNNPMAPNIKVVLVTSSVDQADREKAAQYPMVEDFLVKPLLKLNSLQGLVAL